MPAWKPPGGVRRCDKADSDTRVAGSGCVAAHGDDLELEVDGLCALGGHHAIAQGCVDRDVREEDAVLAFVCCADVSLA